MKRIIVLGCSGSGKSYFSKQLHKLTGIPLFHLDNIWWTKSATHISRESFDIQLAHIMKNDEWIIDGDYSRTYEERFKKCDTVFFFDLDTSICLEAVNSRVGEKRSDIPWVETELDIALVDDVKRYAAEKRPKVMQLLEKYSDREIVIFQSREQVEKWLKNYF